MIDSLSDDIEGAIQMANDTVYGLTSGVYAKDKASALKIAREIRAGQCYIQGSLILMPPLAASSNLEMGVNGETRPCTNTWKQKR